MFNIDGEGVPKEGTIGVVVSGGFDSSLLWHIVYGICKDRGQKCIPFTVPKNDGALRYADRMLEYSQRAYGGKRLHPFVVNSEGVDKLFRNSNTLPKLETSDAWYFDEEVLDHVKIPSK